VVVTLAGLAVVGGAIWWSKSRPPIDPAALLEDATCAPEPDRNRERDVAPVG
jgi:hypothetical protein